MVSPSPRIRLAARKVKGRHLMEVVHAPVAAGALTWYREDCVAGGGASGAGAKGGGQVRTACGPLACCDLTAWSSRPERPVAEWLEGNRTVTSACLAWPKTAP